MVYIDLKILFSTNTCINSKLFNLKILLGNTFILISFKYLLILILFKLIIYLDFNKN